MSDEVAIGIGGQLVSGWQEIEITRRAEGFPPDFSIGMSVPVGSTASLAVAGAGCTVMIGGDLVITGFIDRDVQSGSDGQHQVALVGRGATADLVDCSGQWPTGQRTDVDALTIAQTLAQPYQLRVRLGPGATAGPSVPQWLLQLGETGAEIIQRVARNAGLLAYEDTDGVLVLAKVGAERAASGVVYGGNVQAWTAENGMDGRFSEIVCSRLATDSLQELAGDDFYDRAYDPNVLRHRRLYMVAQAVGADDPFAFTSTRARWEQARRAGRSAVVHATVDSWRDSAGKLWTPNTLVPVSVPGNRGGAELVLGEVTYRRSSESGTTADLVLMPPAAFTPEPIVLQPVSLADVKGSDQ
ncbi:phage baseplate assembly protein [Sphingomonas bacterium]|uniref:phage baseplate assembly protein n=1 Tax=Sphingomonas bacterium TaxID=1895847 RepID=UPI00157664C7|nr:contractile injection system protein, VgrG/Pvc8 family [Sphingomonas bacterium]